MRALEELLAEEEEEYPHEGDMMKLREESEKVSLPRERLVNPQCRFASNPYHLCEIYCFQTAPQCRFASNPYHLCDSYCFQTAPYQNKRAKYVMKLRSLRKITSFASIPYHESAKSCFGVSAVRKPKGEGKAILTKESWENSKCQFASNPYHKCPKYCSQNASKQERRGQVVAKEEGVCRFASNRYHECDEYCFQNPPNRKNNKQVFLKSMNKDEKILSRDKSINDDYQFQDAPKRNNKLIEMRSKEEKIMFLEGMNLVNSLLQSESNSSHQCIEYFLQNSPFQMKRHEQVAMKSNEENNAILIEERRANLNCQFTENSYHEHAKHYIKNEQKERPELDFLKEKYHQTMPKKQYQF